MPTFTELNAALPAKGLFRGEELPFLLSSKPFPLDAKLVKKLERLGHTLFKFQMASDRLYKRSKKGTIPAWVSQTLDAGKPEWLVEAQQSRLYQHALPRVIRPDLLLTENGFSLTELDSVPGGIGVTAWLQSQYTSEGREEQIIGSGMIEGFQSIIPDGGQIHISDESSDYRPEMEWLVERLNATQEEEKWEAVPAETSHASGATYRFFELFDWEQLPHIKSFLTQECTPPLKPHLEEKLWLALFHTPSLRAYWEEELRGKQLRALEDVIPYGWVVDPTPLPPHAALPRLEVNQWKHVGEMSQKDRKLVLKISGFSELSWGSRGVKIGHDCAALEWQEALSDAVEEFSQHPHVLQEFADTKLVEHPYYDPESGKEKVMKGRVRLCPYYFVSEDYKEVKLGGVLVTVNPADKKKIHGMRDAILTVASVEQA